MNRCLLNAAAVGLLLCTSVRDRAQGQGVGVPVYSPSSAAENSLRAAAEKLRVAGQQVGQAVLTNQLNRSACDLRLPPPRNAALTGRELWSVARIAHLRVGWYYLCSDCGNRHLNLAAGYALSEDGAIATCYHVVAPPETSREGFLVVADENGALLPVKEILAANQALDVCILRVIAAGRLNPLPLQTNVFPGDRCVCFSDPLGQRGYFSDGIVSRFLHPRSRRADTNAPAKREPAPAAAATRLNVTTDWAPGSSGAAVLDDCGNAIGHVTAISTLSDHASGRARSRGGDATLITIHEAVSARDVLSLIRKR